jgi:hypothetical protein
LNKKDLIFYINVLFGDIGQLHFNQDTMEELGKKEFYALHEEVIKKADVLCNGLNKEKDYAFYGEGSEANKPDGIANVVNKFLKENGYHFKYFRLAANKEKYIFNGSALRKAKDRYNTAEAHGKVEFEGMYIDAFLYFLNMTRKDLTSLAKNYEIKDKINKTSTTKSRPKRMRKQNKEDEQSMAKFEAVEQDFNSDFYLYSYNEKWKTIYKAVLEIRPSNLEFKVTLKNVDKKGLFYSGKLDYRLINNSSYALRA